jgi:hypothetical protein
MLVLLASAALADTAPAATLSGSTLELALLGRPYELLGELVLTGRTVEVRWDQPTREGANRLRVDLGRPRDGLATAAPDPVLVELQPGSDQGTLQNVTAACSVDGTVRFDDKLRRGRPASGVADLLIACRGVDALPSALEIRGPFTDLPVR